MNSKLKPVTKDIGCFLNEYRNDIERQIEKCPEHSAYKKTKWVEKELPSVYEKLTSKEEEGRGWYWQIMCQAHHFHYYEARGLYLKKYEYENFLKRFPEAEKILAPVITRTIDEEVCIAIEQLSEDQKKKLGKKVLDKIKEFEKKQHIRTAHKAMMFPKKEIPKTILSQMKTLQIPGLPNDESDTLPNMQLLPPYSFFLRLQFKLEKPYISKDDTDFYIIDNPIKKDKVFKVPFIAASSWKGNLRWMMTHQLVEWWKSSEDMENSEPKTPENFAQKRFRLTLLFGNENEAYQEYLDKQVKEAVEPYQAKLQKKAYKEGLFSGRLYFYPTFFDRISLEVIGPHDRKTKAIGKTGPILFESVPIDTKGLFSLLYVPFDLIGKPETVRKEVADDLEFLPDALQKLMQLYGFSAKRTSGFGVVKDRPVKGIIAESQMQPFQKALLQQTREQQLRTQLEQPEKFESFDEMSEKIQAIVAELRA